MKKTNEQNFTKSIWSQKNTEVQNYNKATKHQQNNKQITN
jgi:hypothetical protein